MGARASNLARLQGQKGEGLSLDPRPRYPIILDEWLATRKLCANEDLEERRSAFSLVPDRGSCRIPLGV
jgi:hypothetical protein